MIAVMKMRASITRISSAENESPQAAVSIGFDAAELEPPLITTGRIKEIWALVIVDDQHLTFRRLSTKQGGFIQESQ